MIVDHGTKSINIKIVFFGPAMSGKTTCINYLFSSLGMSDRLVSIENTVGRTMFCDFGTIPIMLNDSWTINAHVWSATGQDFYRSTRQVVLIGTDGVIFVADSQRSLLGENQASWNELLSMIDEMDRPLPLVVCLNKQDLQDVVDEAEFRTSLNIPSSVPIFKSAARIGLNVMEAFNHIFERALHTAIMIQG